MSAPVQRNDEWLQQATPAEIADAHHAGELAELMAQDRPAPVQAAAPEGQLPESALKTMTTAEVHDAFEAGQLEFLLGRTKAPL